MPKQFLVSVPVMGNCSVIIEAASEAEAERKARELPIAKIPDLAESVQIDEGGISVLEEVHS